MTCRCTVIFHSGVQKPSYPFGSGSPQGGPIRHCPLAPGPPVSDAIQSALNALFVGPLWPASVLLLLVACYLTLSLVGAASFDGPDLDVDSHGWQGIGASSLRWFHLGEIPLVIWLGLFAIFQWLIAFSLWTFFESARYEPTLKVSSLLAIRNAVIASIVTRIATSPLVPYFRPAESFGEETLLGETCVVCSGEATETFGQAKVSTGGAPLLLNVRTDGSHLVKGDHARIVALDRERRIYTITRDSLET